MSDATWVWNSDYQETMRKHTVMNRERNVADAKVAKAKNNLREEERKYQKEFDKQESNIKNIEARLKKEAGRYQEYLDELNDELRLEIGRQNVWMSQQLDSIRQEVATISCNQANQERKLNDFIREYEAKWKQLSEKTDKQGERGRVLQAELALLCDRLGELHPDKLAPVEVQSLLEAMDYIEDNLSNKDYEAAIALAQENIISATELINRLEIMNHEYAVAVQEVGRLIESVGEQLEELSIPNRNERTLEEQGEQIFFDGEIDFWSNGLFQSMLQRYETYCQTVREQYQPEMKTEQINQVIGILCTYEQGLQECVELAHNEYTEYHFLSMLAQAIYDALAEDSWMLVSDSFVNDDKRNAYNMEFDNGCGQKASVVIMQQREVVSTDRKGRVNYGKTQFRVAVHEDGEEDTYVCNIAREGIFALIAAKMDIGNSNRHQVKADEVYATFVERYATESDRMRDKRINNVRTRIGI